jgi:hypothetical protein
MNSAIMTHLRISFPPSGIPLGNEGYGDLEKFAPRCEASPVAERRPPHPGRAAAIPPGRMMQNVTTSRSMNSKPGGGASASFHGYGIFLIRR